MTQPVPRVCVRKATADDADAACSAVRRSIAEVCGPDYGHEEKVMTDWLANKTPDNFRWWIEAPDAFSLVAVSDSDDVVGFGRISQAGWVQVCYIVPEALYQGYGKALLAAMEQQAAQWGLSAVGLNSTITAKAFYERNGYRQTGEPKKMGSTLGDFPMAKNLYSQNDSASHDPWVSNRG